MLISNLGIILLYLVTITVADDFEAPAFKIHVGYDCDIGTSCFIPIPRTYDEAMKEGWVIPPDSPKSRRIKMFCKPNNNRFCVLMDRRGSIAGCQISIPQAVDSLNMAGFDYETKGFHKQTLFGESIYSIQAWFVPQRTLITGRRYNNQTGTGLWLPIRDKLFQVPIHECGLYKTSFKRTTCMPSMGQHWFWNVTLNLTQEEFLPWFTLHNNDGILHGFGFISFGGKADPLFSPTFEPITDDIITAIAPPSPKWIYEYNHEYKMYSLHFYFIKEPWAFKCQSDNE